MARSFSADVGAWVRKSEARIEAVLKMSALDVISEMNEVGPSVANPDSFGTGHLPVDTGFLRASLQAAINRSAPAIQFRPPTGNFAYDVSPVAMVIAGAAITDTIFATYTAVYAPIMNAKYGFRDLAVQNWGSIVAKNARLARQRVTGR